MLPGIRAAELLIVGVFLRGQGSFKPIQRERKLFPVCAFFNLRVAPIPSLETQDVKGFIWWWTPLPRLDEGGGIKLDLKNC